MTIPPPLTAPAARLDLPDREVVVTVDRTRERTTVPRLITRSDGGGYRWLVVAANGRVMGASAARFASAAGATDDFYGLCRVISDLPVSFGRASAAREWTWRVGDHEGGHVAMSLQAYERHSTARASFGRFVQAARALCDVPKK